jgi:hypothetical protein
MIRGLHTNRFDFRALLSVFLVFVSTTSDAFSQGANEKAWLTVTSEGGNYSVSMPGKPIELGTPFGVGDFRGVSHVINVRSAGSSYSALYVDLPIDPSDETIADKVFDAVKNDLLGKPLARVLEENKIDLKGNPGRAIKAQAPNGVIVSRNYLVKNRLYQLIVIVPDNAPFDNADKFLNSFSITDTEKQSF